MAEPGFYRSEEEFFKQMEGCEPHSLDTPIFAAVSPCPTVGPGATSSPPAGTEAAYFCRQEGQHQLEGTPASSALRAGRSVPSAALGHYRYHFSPSRLAVGEASDAQPGTKLESSAAQTTQKSYMSAETGRELDAEEFLADEGKSCESLIRDLLSSLGEDPQRDGLRKTPSRVRRSLDDLTRGYRMDPREVVGDALFDESSGGMVTIRGIEFYSLCEHHLLPFFGKVHISYLPNGKVLGLSKFPRLVDIFARRLQVQERLTRQILEAISEFTAARGVGVIIEGSHLCMMMRGVEKQNSTTFTSAFAGLLDEDQHCRDQMFRAISHPGSADR